MLHFHVKLSKAFSEFDYGLRGKILKYEDAIWVRWKPFFEELLARIGKGNNLKGYSDSKVNDKKQQSSSGSQG